MIFLKKTALVTVIVLASAGAQAELKELGDSTMNELVAKAGITIDMAFKLSIGEIFFDYSNKDAINGARVSGQRNTQTMYYNPAPRIGAPDNIRVDSGDRYARNRK